MSHESTHNFKIVNSAIKIGDGLHYDIILTETSGIIGTADLNFTSVDFCMRDTRYEPLLKAGLRDIDKIANLAYFHPYEAYEQDLNLLSASPIRGAASEELLNRIIDDASKQECKAIIVLTGRDKMKRLLKNHGFVPTDLYEQEYYRLLTSSSI